MPVAGAMAENATLFVVYNQTQAILQRLYPPSTPSTPDEPAPLSIWQTATAAAVAGAAVSFVLTPVELVKCKMQVSNIAAEGFASSTAAHAVASASHAPAAKPIPSSFMRPNPASPGAIAVTRSILREYGVRGLWLGQTGTLIRETGGGAAWFTTFEVVSQWFIQRRVARGEVSAKDGGRVTKGDLAAWELMSAGAGAGIMYNVVLFPADCIKSTIQTEDELRGKGEAKGPRRGFFQVGKDIYAARGVRGLYNGCGITALRAAPSSALIFYMCVVHSPSPPRSSGLTPSPASFPPPTATAVSKPRSARAHRSQSTSHRSSARVYASPSQLDLLAPARESPLSPSRTS